MENNSERLIIRNIIKAPDGTILESSHRHDYQTHADKNGEVYVNDGGKMYLRRSVNKEPYEDLTIYSDDSIEKIREYFQWGTYGKNGDEYRVKILKDLSNPHIEAIIKTQIQLSEIVKNIFIRELNLVLTLSSKSKSFSISTCVCAVLAKHSLCISEKVISVILDSSFNDLK